MHSEIILPQSSEEREPMRGCEMFSVQDNGASGELGLGGVPVDGGSPPFQVKHQSGGGEFHVSISDASGVVLEKHYALGFIRSGTVDTFTAVLNGEGYRFSYWGAEDCETSNPSPTSKVND